MQTYKIIFIILFYCANKADAKYWSSDSDMTAQAGGNMFILCCFFFPPFVFHKAEKKYNWKLPVLICSCLCLCLCVCMCACVRGISFKGLSQALIHSLPQQVSISSSAWITVCLLSQKWLSQPIANHYMPQ